MKNILLILFALFVIASCASKKDKFSSDNFHGFYKVGQPYKVGNKEFVPKEQPEYDEVGMSSWYGTDFTGKKTANGDTYDKNSLTAAHNTLPLPSMVRITNLENNKTLIVMVNDRGPFSKGRIIDVSQRAAEILGYKDKGTAKVRVQFLKGQTKRLLADLPKEKKSTFSGLFKDNSVYADSIDDDKAAASVAATAAATSAPTPLIAEKKDAVSNISVASATPALTPPTVAVETKSAANSAETAAGDDVAIAKSDSAKLAPKTSAKAAKKKAPAKKSAAKSKAKTKAKVAKAQPKEETIDTEFGPAKVEAEPAAKAAAKASPKESVVELDEESPAKASAAAKAEAAAVPANVKKVDKYFIQAGTFSVKTNAEKALRGLKPLGDVAIKNIVSGGKTMYRVRLGPMDDSDIAKKALEKVITLGHADAILVSEAVSVE
jgi:rare lipoprotein A